MLKSTVLLLLVSFNLYSQSGKASFVFSTPKQSFPCELVFDANSSVFLLDLDRPFQKGDVEDKSNFNRNQVIVDVADGKKFFVLKDTKNKKLVSRELLYNGEKVVLNDTLQNFNWLIQNERKVIAGLICQKATTTFRCADYTAWFTIKIPVQHGPAKMGGLPGLILELTNETVKHVYTLDKLDFPLQNIQMVEKINTKNGDKQLNYSEFAKMQQTELKKMEMFLKAQADNPKDGRFKASIPECFN